MDFMAYPLSAVITTFGDNNKTATNYVGNESANTILEYTYENDFPTQAVAKYDFNGSTASTTDFYYE